MSKIKDLIQFTAVLVFLLGLVFSIHVAILHAQDLPLFGNMIVLSYTVNFILATAIFAALYMLRYKLKNQIGFLFMVGSMLKFVLFFIVFYPVYREDGDMDRLEFAAFFVPYAISLVVETIFTAKMLKKIE